MKGFRSIRLKLLAVVLVTTFSALFVAGATFLAYDLNTYRAARINDMTTQIELLAGSSAAALQFEDQAVANENLSLLRIRPTVQAAAIYNARGNLFASYSRGGEPAEFPLLPEQEGVSTESSNLVIFQRIVQNDEILGTAYMRADYLLPQRAMNFIGILAVVTAGAMLVAMLVSLWLQTIITRPILSIAGIAREVVSHKAYSRRAEKLSSDEVGALVDAFNDMLDEIGNRTRALENTNRELEQEVAERKRAREEVLRLNQELERKVEERTRQLRVTNQELESFCYSVSHDLRAPLRSISGFSQALGEELEEAMGEELPGESRRYFDKIIAATGRMGQLIEDLLNLSRVSRGKLERQEVDFSAMAEEVMLELKGRDPERKVDISIWGGIHVDADAKLLRIVLGNLLSNAWKFSSREEQPRIEVGFMRDGPREVYFVRDNGAGFDMKYSDKLFGAFQRLHGANEFPGTGIGLATVQRIIHRHGGRVWCDSSPGRGAVFYFTLKPHSRPHSGDKRARENGARKGKLRSV